MTYNSTSRFIHHRGEATPPHRVLALAGLLFVVLLATPGLLQAQTFRAVLQSVDGRVEVRLPGNGWEPGEQGMEIPVDAEISTSFSSEAVLALGDAAVLRVRPLTRMRVDQLIKRDDSIESEMFLRVGRVRGEVQSAEGVRSDFRFRSPVVTASVRGTDFTFNGRTVRVLTGLVSVSNPYGRQVSVIQNEETSVDPTDPPSDPENERTRRSIVSSTTPGSGAGSDTNNPIRTIPEDKQAVVIDVTY